MQPNVTLTSLNIQHETLIDMNVIRELAFNIHLPNGTQHLVNIPNNQNLQILHLIGAIRSKLQTALPTLADNNQKITLKKGAGVLTPEHSLQETLSNGDVIELTTSQSTGAQKELSADDQALLASFVDNAISSDVEIVFVFDTTGSMSSIIENVKTQVEGTVSRLIKDIPNIKIGIMGLGDYCDGDNLLKVLDLTNNVTALVSFIKNVPMTGGGDTPEAYEYALRRANGLSWSYHTSKALVMIGDAGPHPPSYTDQQINWLVECDVLASKGVKIYGVKARCDEPAFYDEIAERTGGLSINFDKFSLITEMFQAICFRETSATKFREYQNEVFNATAGVPVEMTRIFDELSRENFVREDVAMLNTTATNTAVAAPTKPTKIYGEPILPLKNTAFWFNIAKDPATKTTFTLDPSVGYYVKTENYRPKATTAKPVAAAPSHKKPAAVAASPTAASTAVAAIKKPKAIQKVRVQIETRLRKKARESLDFIAGSKQRQESLFNLLGKDYTGPDDEELRMIFRVFDTNHDGKIGYAELSNVLQSMGKRAVAKRINKILAEIDPDNTGEVEIDDFVDYMQVKAANKARQLGLLSSDDDDEYEEPAAAEDGDTDEETEAKPARKAKGSTKRKRASAPSAAAAPEATTKKPDLVTKQASFFSKLPHGSSLSHFYTKNAAVCTFDANPVGNEYDLGLDGAFASFTVLVLDTTGSKQYEKAITEYLKPKAVKTVFVHDAAKFVQQLKDNKVDMAIVLPTQASKVTVSKDFLEAVVSFNNHGKGLYLFGSSDKLCNYTNAILKALYGDKCHLLTDSAVEDDATDDSVLAFARGKNALAGKFNAHLITSGLVRLSEGSRQTHITATLPSELDILASNKLGKGTIVCSNNSVAPNKGRIIVDSAADRLLLTGASNTGVARYLANSVVWLLGLDHRFQHSLPIQGSLVAKKDVHWQFHNKKGWFDFANDVATHVETAFGKGNKDLTFSQGTKTMPVNYTFCLKTMKQITPESHPIRRVEILNVVSMK
ncbi:hypothetical protein SAMD00019534_076470 [Acytostelium subglobosum LB1]|uniref:hypothetical protein n=1 Tax=Acytostelium subglobosum LB1 TaxID=1410327 RepID=UPI000644F49F|nr:hypothetical protein SAMD00019534_076470 [Acytostelium subglobosum LB1]GAM24472.1 hypothetical protein SAMD00019534_076470 [Acytostelium subglobosum LB1]|eukprot:XP_012752798.1 hypothetical protein SAMD00019534_076470 [Acytostelium subglobosum LB1]